MHRAQLSLSVLEAGVAALLVLAVAGLFVLAPANAPPDTGLDRYAGDLATILTGGGPDAPPVGHLLENPDSFERHREATAATARDALPPGLSFRLETAHGDVGDPRPRVTETATRRIVTANGSATLWVWYT